MGDPFRVARGTLISCGFLLACDTASLEVLTPGVDASSETAPPDASEAEAEAATC